ncbi:hypothetical protein ACFWMQ_02825 [Streptomyces sp. NPDC058372]|uniref:hypothetical protein n=1 Tax=unclassified Streptomyces TaxID=2593676 RepID=UPI00364CD2B0
MAHHHKPNRAVEGASDRDHGRGMPRRPDGEQLEQRTVRDREAAGLPGKAPTGSDAAYRAGQEEVDREVDAGEIPTGARTRKSRDAYPPTRYEE